MAIASDFIAFVLSIRRCVYRHRDKFQLLMEDQVPRSLCVSFIQLAVRRLLITKYTRRVHGYTAHFAKLVYHKN